MPLLEEVEVVLLPGVASMNTFRHVLSYFSEASRQTGKSGLKLAMEIARLRFGPQRVGLTEYFELELFDDTLYDIGARRAFIGHRYSAILDRELNSGTWMAVAYDKILTSSILDYHGFPTPPTVATFSKIGRRLKGEAVLTSIDDFLSFIECRRPFPFFIKPIHGYSGVAAYGVKAIDVAAGSVTLMNEQTISLDRLVKDVENDLHEGMLLQEILKPHREIRAVFGDTLGTFRVIVLLKGTSPKLHMAFWKIVKKGNMVDNFSYGLTGNMLGWINRESGVLERVIGGFWPNNKEVINNPETGLRMQGFAIPGWKAVKEICLGAAVHFPGIRLQSWDVALCDDGPILMELNTGADLQIPQVVGRVPFLSPDIRELVH